MKVVIDALNSSTGFTLSNASLLGENDHRDYIAGWQNKSLIFGFNAEGSTISKTITPVSTAGYEYIIFSCWSRKKNKGAEKVSDYEFSIDFGNGKRYFQPTNEFRQIIIPVSQDATISQIKIEREKSTAILCVSYMVLAKVEIPLDAFIGLQESINKQNKPLSAATGITTTAGDTYLVGDYNYVKRYNVIRIYDSVNSETHEVYDYSNGRLTFTDSFDGAAIVNTFANATIEILYYVQYGTTEDRAIIPSITIWGMGERPDKDSNEEDIRLVGATDTLYWITKDNRSQDLNIQIVITAESYQQISEMKRIVENMLRIGTIWINGVKHLVSWDEQTVPVEPQDPTAIIPENIYNVTVSVREALWQTIETVKTTTQTLEVEIQH